MARLNMFTIRLNDSEKRMVARLSKHLQRTQSDAVRLLIRMAVQELLAEDGRKPAGGATRNAGTTE